jgi:predicted nucleic acid-binding protein
MLVVDACFLVDLLSDRGARGAWAAEQAKDEDLTAPTLVQYEVANVLRRLQKSTQISAAEADAAFTDFIALRLALVPFDDLRVRVWALRENFTAYDASYVAAAELLRVPLVTTDSRIERGPKVGCVIRAFVSSD